MMRPTLDEWEEVHWLQMQSEELREDLAAQQDTIFQMVRSLSHLLTVWSDSVLKEQEEQRRLGTVNCMLSQPPLASAEGGAHAERPELRGTGPSTAHRCWVAEDGREAANSHYDTQVACLLQGSRHVEEAGLAQPAASSDSHTVDSISFGSAVLYDNDWANFAGSAGSTLPGHITDSVDVTLEEPFGVGLEEAIPPGGARHSRRLPPGGTSLIARNIPARYSQERLMEEWQPDGSYDLLYLPYCFTRKRTVGYAFLNFRTHELALAFQDRWHGSRLQFHGTTKRLDIAVATTQGYVPSLLFLLQRSKKVRRFRSPNFLPALFDGTVRLDTHAECARLQAVFPAIATPISGPATPPWPLKLAPRSFQ
mmetsp:Transcript_57747/g.185601  ORF Transcript_57747/g.185601 Transcript_57747/m.185601 type:complete len:366 (+) Transcript_57747:118-1215(+)